MHPSPAKFATKYIVISGLDCFIHRLAGPLTGWRRRSSEAPAPSGRGRARGRVEVVARRAPARQPEVVNTDPAFTPDVLLAVQRHRARARGGGHPDGATPPGQAERGTMGWRGQPEPDAGVRPGQRQVDDVPSPW